MVLTAGEIKKVAPDYKGKPENFKLGFKKPRRQEQKSMEIAPSRDETTKVESGDTVDKPQKRRIGPSSKKLPPPLGQNKNPSPVRHDSVLFRGDFRGRLQAHASTRTIGVNHTALCQGYFHE